jgi:glycosyltransferase involved in cell wall biosynthesis
MDFCAAGLPIVGNVPGHAARVIEAGPSGLVVPPDDAAALAAALQKMAMDRPRREAMGRAARLQAMRLWDRRGHSTRFCEVVEAVALAG